MKPLLDASTDSTGLSFHYSTRNTSHPLLDVFTKKLVSKTTKATSAINTMEYTTLVRFTNFYRAVTQILNIYPQRAKPSYKYNTFTPVNSLSTLFQKRKYLVSTLQIFYLTTTDKNKYEMVTINTMKYKPSPSSHERVALSSIGTPELTEKAALTSNQQTAEVTVSETKSQRHTSRKTTDKFYFYFWSEAEVKSTTSAKPYSNYYKPSDVVTVSTTTENSNYDDNYTEHQTTMLSEVTTNKTDEITSRESRKTTYLKTTLPDTWVNDASDSSGTQ